MRLAPPALYAAFDVYPSPKGAAHHIREMAGTLFDAAGGGLLYVMGDPGLPAYQREPGGVEIVRFCRPIPNLLERTLAFGAELAGLLERIAGGLAIAHFRDPWSGVPILADPGRRFRTVYEINGLPSIELPAAWPQVAPRTLEKIRSLERRCWTEADAVIAPSRTLAANLVDLGVPAERIHVVPNGADTARPADPATVPRPPDAPPRYVIYTGALQAWQGVDVLLRALARLRDLDDLHLVVCSATRPRRVRPYERLAARLEVADRVVWRFGLPREALWPWLVHAAASAAPLTECARNVRQGCCPLKILDAMAAGVPVVASDLPSVRELVTDGEHGVLVPAERPAELARAIRVLLEHPDHARALGANGRRRVEAELTWARSREALRDVYRRLGLNETTEGTA